MTKRWLTLVLAAGLAAATGASLSPVGAGALADLLADVLAPQDDAPEAEPSDSLSNM